MSGTFTDRLHLGPWLQFYHGMTRYDYKYQRKQQARVLRPHRMRRVSRAALYNLLFGLLVGLAGSVYYAWEIAPVQYVDNSPQALRGGYAHDYLLLIAQTYAVEQDIGKAHVRLGTLVLEEPTQFVSRRAEEMIAAGFNTADIRAMAVLAQALGATNPTMDPYLR